MRSRSICSVVSLVHSCSYWRMASERWTWGKGGVGEVMYNGGVDIEEKGRIWCWLIGKEREDRMNGLSKKYETE